MISTQAASSIPGDALARAAQGAGVSIAEAGSAGVAVNAADSLPDIAPIYGMPDSLSASDVSSPAADTLQTTADHIFGPLSRLLEPQQMFPGFEVADTFMSNNIVFKLVVLFVFGIYCISLYLYRGQALTVLNIFRSKLYVDNLLGEHSYTFDTFLNIVIAQGVLSVGLATVKTMDVFYWREIAAAVPEWGMPLIVPAVVIVFGVVFFYQSLILVSTGALTHSQKFISRLRYLRKINFALFSLIFMPLLLMVLMASGVVAMPVVMVLALGLIFIVIFYLARTYLIFVDENISKLYWFLYLCAVEIFPVSFLILFFGKFFT